MLRTRPRPYHPAIAAIRAEARKRHLTAYRIAMEAGLQFQTVRRLLNGIGSPTLDTLEATARALGLTVKVLPLA